MNETNPIRVRDARKPGHCWQDNELYDVFQPIIGPMAMLVYLQMTRECYGHTVEFSLRELGAAAGVSKDTAQRSLAILELIGMARRTRAGSVRVPAQYELTDLKDLCRHYGGIMQRARASYVLPGMETARLREKVKEFLSRDRAPKSGPSTVSVGDSSAGRHETAHVSQRKDSAEKISAPATVSVGDSGNRDAGGSEDRSAGDEVVSQNGVYCLPGETPLYNNTQNNKTNPSPTPPLPGGVENKPPAAKAELPHVDAFAWGRFRLALKQALCDAMPLGRQQRMPSVVKGQEDYDACFRDWWLRGWGFADGGDALRLETDSADPESTRRGLEKYRRRIEDLMVSYFGGIVQIEVVAADAVDADAASVGSVQ